MALFSSKRRYNSGLLQQNRIFRTSFYILLQHFRAPIDGGFLFQRYYSWVNILCTVLSIFNFILGKLSKSPIIAGDHNIYKPRFILGKIFFKNYIIALGKESFEQLFPENPFNRRPQKKSVEIDPFLENIQIPVIKIFKNPRMKKSTVGPSTNILKNRRWVHQKNIPQINDSPLKLS